MNREKLKSTNRLESPVPVPEVEQSAGGIEEAFPQPATLSLVNTRTGEEREWTVTAAGFRDLVRAEREFPGEQIIPTIIELGIFGTRALFWFALSQSEPELTLDEVMDWIPYLESERYECVNVIFRGLAFTKKKALPMPLPEASELLTGEQS